MELLLLRHGQPVRTKKVTNFNPPLTDFGHQQAVKVSKFLESISLDVLITSPLTRAVQTGEPTSQTLKMPLLEEPGIAEVDSEGVGYVHVEDLRVAGGEIWSRFLQDPIATLGGDEAEFKARVLDGFNRILIKNRDAHRVAVFTHGFPINVLLSHALGLKEITRFMPAHGSITRLAGRRLDSLAVISVNETGHLQR